MENKYYYHVTQKIWKNNIILKPKKYGTNRPDNEPIISRICVSPSIKQCFLSLGECLWEKRSIFIFRTKNKIKTSPSFNVADSHMTDERWILKPCSFLKLGKINPNNLPEEIFKTRTGHKKFLLEQKKLFSILKNIDFDQLIE